MVHSIPESSIMLMLFSLPSAVYCKDAVLSLSTVNVTFPKLKSGSLIGSEGVYPQFQHPYQYQYQYHYYRT